MPLPPGLLLNTETGELTGVPTVAGTYAVQLKVRDLLGTEKELTDSVTINAYTPMSWVGDFGPLMATRAPPAITLSRVGGLGPYSYTVIGGSLPDGLSLNASTGEITGTPTTPGAYALTIRATDALDQTRDTVLSGTVVTNLDLSHASATKLGNVSLALTNTATRTGGTAPFEYEITSGTLPPGLSMSEASGTVSGTPTQAFDAVVIITVTDDDGFTDTSTVTYDINAYPSISGSLQRGMVGKAYSRTFTGSGGHTPYVWSVTNPPTSVSMNSGSGVLSGTPSVAGSYSTVVTLTDDIGAQETLSGSLEIAAALDISGSYTAEPTRNLAYPTFTANVVGGWPPFTFDISVGSLPLGLTLHATEGTITGTPATQANYTATLRVTDAEGSTDTMAVNINVQGDVTIAGGIPALGTTTVAFTGDNLSVSGGLAPYTWSISAGALPTGLSMNTSTGDITGTPTVAGAYAFTIRATDANGSYDEHADTVTVAAAPVLSGNLPDSTNGSPYSQALTRTGGHSAFTYEISAGALPTGLSIAAATGIISGTPTVNGAYSFTVKVTDADGNIDTHADAITVYAAVALSGDYAANTEAPYSTGADPTAYSSSGVSVSGGKSPIVWSLAGGTLPPGLLVSAGSGTLAGDTEYISEASGLGYTDYNFTVRATDALGSTDTLSQTVRMYWHVKKVSGSFPAATKGVAYSASVPAAYGKSPYTHAVLSGTLPTGLSINASTGLITGTPSVSGVYGIWFRYTDALSKSHDWNQTFSVNAEASISGAAPDGTQNVAFGYTYTKSGGNGVYAFSLASGSLPPGVTLNSSTGRIGGTPTTLGTYSFTVRVTSAGSTDTVADSVQIKAQPNLSLAYTHGTVGQSYTATASTTGGHTPYTYSRHSGTLPPGLTLSGVTGTLFGTPSVAGSYGLMIRVTDDHGNISLESKTVTIAAALNIPGVFASPAQQSAAYSSQISASGGWSPYSFSQVSGSLPTGLSLAANGTLSGTPTTPGTYNFTVRVTDDDGNTFDRAKTVVVNAPAFNVTISPNPASSYAFGGGSTVTVSKLVSASVTGAVGTVSYSWTKIGSTGGPAFSHGATSGAGFLAQYTTRFDYEETETWRVTATTSSGQSDTAQVDITLSVISGA